MIRKAKYYKLVATYYQGKNKEYEKYEIFSSNKPYPGEDYLWVKSHNKDKKACLEYFTLECVKYLNEDNEDFKKHGLYYLTHLFNDFSKEVANLVDVIGCENTEDEMNEIISDPSYWEEKHEWDMMDDMENYTWRKLYEDEDNEYE